MATKSKTTTKPRTTKKTVKGSGGLKKNNTNWTFIIVLLVLVTAVGGYFAYRSQIKAASGTVWNVRTNNPNPISNFGGTFPKDDGSQGWQGNPGNWIKIRVNIVAANKDKRMYCAEGNSNTAGVGTSLYGTQSAINRFSKPAITFIGAGGWRACATANSSFAVGEYFDFYLCGKKTADSASCSDTSKVIGGIQVQNFYRP